MLQCLSQNLIGQGSCSNINHDQSSSIRNWACLEYNSHKTIYLHNCINEGKWYIHGEPDKHGTDVGKWEGQNLRG